MLKQFKEGVCQSFFKHEGLSRDNIELELKFKGITKLKFLRVLSRLHLMGAHRIEEETSIDFFLGNGTRLTKRDSELYDTTKIRTFDQIIPQSESVAETVRLTMSYEKNNRLDDTSIVECAKFRRVKNRTSFFFKKVRIDCTVVDTTEDANVLTGYEIEIEALDLTEKDIMCYADDCILTILSEAFHKINTVLFEALIISKFNDVVDSKVKDKIYTRALANARDLKKSDITLDGLANGDYTITTKADGIRVILYIDIYGIWKIQPAKDEDIVVKIGEVPNELKTVFPIFLDCEEVFDELEEREVYIPFDTIVIKTKKIQERPLIGENNSRFSLVKKTVGILQKYINVTIKPFIELGKTHESFSKAFKEISSFSKEQNYENDGFIMTPMSTSYISLPNRRHDRNLSNSAEICKLKPWEKLSIDIILRSNKVYVTSNEGKLVEFKGTDKHRFDLDNLDLEGWPEGEHVVEAAPKRVDDTIKLYAYRIRSDKSLPNGENVAKSIWDSLHDHISPDTVLGHDLKLVRMYHNDIKRYVLRLLNDNSPRNSTKSIVDIGSGRLGDLMKWTHVGIDRVLAVEPNEDNIAEAYSRLKNYKGKTEVKIVQASGEDTELIVDSADFGPEESISIVSMLSMSFFFIDDDHFENFCHTLRSLATKFSRELWFYFFTVDGDSVKRVFGKSSTKTFDIVKMELDTDTELLRTNIEGTIVENYVEGLPDIQRLVNHLTPMGKDPFLTYETLVDPAANRIGIPRYLFNESNKTFNSLYSYGAMKIYPY